MDAGWLKTADALFDKAVSQIFPTVIEQLSLKSDYSYTIGDIYFFRRYY